MPTDLRSIDSRARLPGPPLPHHSGALDSDRIGPALGAFDLGGQVLSARPFGAGHINATFRSEVQLDGSDGQAEFLHQRMNEVVFGDLDALMANVDLITTTLAGVGLACPKLIPARDGAAYARVNGEAWRTFRFERNTVSHDRCPSPDHAFEAARSFGAYQAGLANLNPAQMRITIPKFFDGRHRLEQFAAALRQAPAERLAELAADLEFAHSGAKFLEPIETAIARGNLPARIVHGDTKLNNVLFEAAPPNGSPKVRCVIDLDTTMSAFGPFDFGDLARFTSATAPEDTRDLDQMDADPALLEALKAGWLESIQGFATRAEHELLEPAAQLVTYLSGLRFLTDHLAGDVYFRVHRPGQNLDRARAQFRLVGRLGQRLGDLRS